MTRFARPSGSPLTPFAVCPAGCASSRTPVGVSHPPADVQYVKKKPVLAYELFLKYGGEGGIDSLCSPLRGSPFAALPVCPTGCASSRTPVGASHPPVDVQHAKKKPVLSYELFLKYGGEGGIDSLRSPFGQPTHSVRGLSSWLRQQSNPGRGFSSPRRCAICEKKARTCVRALLKIWR